MDMIHFDVMDGWFVPNIIFGLLVVKAGGNVLVAGTAIFDQPDFK